MFNKKILCLGNTTNGTDQWVTKLSIKDKTVNHGLISNIDFVPTNPGYYHTTVVDIPEGEIYRLANTFDKVILLDQPIEEWNHPKSLLISYKIIRNLGESGTNVVYKDNKNVQSFLSLHEKLKNNKSFCIHPWVTYYEQNGNLKLCPRSTQQIAKVENLKDWQSALEYTAIRQKMLNGELLPENCSVCYDYERHGIESYRQYETQEWLAKLKIEKIEDLDNIKHPYFYDTKLSNKCNIMCRSCDPKSSHLIDEESKKYNIIYPVSARAKSKYADASNIKIQSLTKNSRVYFMGGEPTISPEVYAFMRECVDQRKTDFEFCLGTNGVKFSDTLLDLSKNFSNMHFSFSLDGYGKINDYWRHGSDWDSIVKNMHTVKNLGHTISSNTVPGIYNVTNLHLLFEFLDREFPGISMYMQLNHNVEQSVFNHPNSELVVESMKRCMNTDVYLADGKSTKTGIESIYNHYTNNPECDLKSLKKFFETNDLLDQIRNISLRDYIPELEACRNLL